MKFAHDEPDHGTGKLVFQVAADGWFRAHDALTDKQLWKFNAVLGISGAPISWSDKGVQYAKGIWRWM
jgi:quinohemoprotein ethanol dehydrogenase